MHDFDADNVKRYNPTDYGLPVWRDENHQPPETVAEKAEAKETSMSAEAAKNKLCAYALSQVGYHEGVNNWNQYAEIPEMQQWYGWKPQSTYWCDTFADACFVACFGLELASQMTYQPIGSGSALCRTSADYYKEHGAFYHTPEIGDEIFFYSAGDINHVGIVVRVAGGSVVTVEGNSSDSVAERCYSVSDSKIAGYGRPNWEAVEGEDINVPTEEPVVPDVTEKRFYTLRLPYLSKGNVGDDVWVLQTLLQAHNISCGPWGADKDFGSDTEKAVRQFQQKQGLTPDGIVGPETGASLLGGEIVKETNNFGLGAQIAQKIREGE